MQLIPKEGPKIPNWLNILFYAAIAVLVISIVVFLVLGHSLNKSRKTLEDLNEALVKQETAQNLALEKEVLGYQQKIGDFSNLIKEHVKTSKVFEILEKNTHPQIAFSYFSLNSPEKTLVLTGNTRNFENLGQQFLIFQRESMIEKTLIEKISIGKTGNIEFTFSLTLNPQIFK
jgi:hypothetical protein